MSLLSNRLVFQFHPFVFIADHSDVMAFQVYGALTTLSNLCSGSIPLKLKFLELNGIRAAMIVAKYFTHHEDACISYCWALQNVCSYVSGFEPGVKAVVSAGALHIFTVAGCCMCFPILCSKHARNKFCRDTPGP